MGLVKVVIILISSCRLHAGLFSLALFFLFPPPSYEALEVLLICMDLEIQRKNKYCICVKDSSFQLYIQ